MNTRKRFGSIIGFSNNVDSYSTEEQETMSHLHICTALQLLLVVSKCETELSSQGLLLTPKNTALLSDRDVFNRGSCDVPKLPAESR